MEFQEQIKPFFWVQHAGSTSVCLDVGNFMQEVFDSRADEGFEGSGYDWESLAAVFIEEKCPELEEVICFDSEGSMFCAYSKDAEALRDFISRFREACDDKSLILDLFSRAELD